MRRKLLVMSVLAAAVATLQFGPVQAASGGICAVGGHVSLTGPLNSLTVPASGTFNFESDTTLSCAGVLSNQAVIPVASAVTSVGPYGGTTLGPLNGDTCGFGQSPGGFSSSTLTASFTASVAQATGGNLPVNGNFQFIRLGTIVIIQGNANGDPLVGVFQFSPDVGQTCVTTPVTRAAVDGIALVG